MSYSSLHKIKKGVHTSLNDPSNIYSYRSTIQENFIPLNFGGIKRPILQGQSIESQQAIQQQIIQIRKQQELLHEQEKQIDNIKKLKTLQKLATIQIKDSTDKLDFIKNPQAEIGSLSELINSQTNSQ